jgi:hypothetical protein
MLLEQEYINNLSDDIKSRQPELIFLKYHETCFACPEELSIVKYIYLRRRQFSFVDEYTQLPAVPGYMVFKRSKNTGGH